jgi:hypothetical protein
VTRRVSNNGTTSSSTHLPQEEVGIRRGQKPRRPAEGRDRQQEQVETGGRRIGGRRETSKLMMSTRTMPTGVQVCAPFFSALIHLFSWFL